MSDDKGIKKISFYSRANLHGKQHNIGSIAGVVYVALTPSEKVYVGKTVNPLIQRIKEHERHSTYPIEAAIKKYGKDNVRWGILFKSKDNEELIREEKKWIGVLQSNEEENGYNLTEGGEGTTGFKYTEDQRKENSTRRKEFFEDPENRRKQSRSNTLAHLNNPKQGQEHSKFQTERFNGPNAQVEREKIADGMSEYLKDDEKLLVHTFQRGGRPFLVLSEDVPVGVFAVASECARQLNLDSSKISNCLKGNRKSHGGFTFRPIGLGTMFEENHGEK